MKTITRAKAIKIAKSLGGTNYTDDISDEIILQHIAYLATHNIKISVE